VTFSNDVFPFGKVNSAHLSEQQQIQLYSWIQIKKFERLAKSTRTHSTVSERTGSESIINSEDSEQYCVLFKRNLKRHCETERFEQREVINTIRDDIGSTSGSKSNQSPMNRYSRSAGSRPRTIRILHRQGAKMFRDQCNSSTRYAVKGEGANCKCKMSWNPA
jgi:hypothetical protein